MIWHLAAFAAATATLAGTAAAYWTERITRRTFAASWALAIALLAISAITQRQHYWATLDVIVVLLMAWVWWTERPAPADRGEDR